VRPTHLKKKQIENYREEIVHFKGYHFNKGGMIRSVGTSGQHWETEEHTKKGKGGV